MSDYKNKIGLNISILTIIMCQPFISFSQQHTLRYEDSLMLAHHRIEKVYLGRAQQNIERYRKGNAVLGFRRADGKTLSGVSVAIKQTSQDFLFGNLCEESFSPELSESERIKFRKYFTGLFILPNLSLSGQVMNTNKVNPNGKSFRKSWTGAG